MRKRITSFVEHAPRPPGTAAPAGLIERVLNGAGVDPSHRGHPRLSVRGVRSAAAIATPGTSDGPTLSPPGRDGTSRRVGEGSLGLIKPFIHSHSVLLTRFGP